MLSLKHFFKNYFCFVLPFLLFQLYVASESGMSLRGYFSLIVKVQEGNHSLILSDDPGYS